MDDIPEVLRDQQNSRSSKRRSPARGASKTISTTPTRSTKSKKKSLLLGMGVVSIFLAIAVMTIISLLRNNSQPSQKIISTTPATKTESKPETPKVESTLTTKKQEGGFDNVLGHLPYSEAPSSKLTPITTDGRIRMRKAAADEFQRMQVAAKADGIIIVPISGFRSIKDQEKVFFGLKQQRGQEATKRAEVSAPPGYSEHHTGYAIDIGDAKVPATNLNQNFEETAAFRWMQKNAPRYNFEISFPQNNKQGVSYEPWHWRFVGDRDSLETFYKAKSLKK
jgi:zinc D-Ala-D-Ala carboxypeptidase